MSYGWGSEALTPQVCYTLCKGQGFAFYGVEWSIMCFCGGSDETRSVILDDVTQLQEEECYLRCPGNIGDVKYTMKCGGQSAIQVWEI